MNSLLQIFDPGNIGAFFAQFRADMQQPSFWLAVGKIIWINVLLSGDNALVIAMACRGLHGRSRLWGIIIGAGIAVLLLITFTGIVATLMSLPYLKLIGGLALIVIAAKLLVPEDEADEITAGTHAVARGAHRRHRRHHHEPGQCDRGRGCRERAVVALGDRPCRSPIPMIIAGAALIMLVLDRFPVLVWIGAMLLGWIAGGVIVSDPIDQTLFHNLLNGHITIEATSAILGASHFNLDGDPADFAASALGGGRRPDRRNDLAAPQASRRRT